MYAIYAYKYSAGFQNMHNYSNKYYYVVSIHMCSTHFHRLKPWINILTLDKNHLFHWSVKMRETLKEEDRSTGYPEQERLI